VVALDVGHGQLAWKLRTDTRVTVFEGLNARHLVPTDLPATALPAEVVTIDVSFISLKHILPVLPPLLRPAADVVVLVKPQFESRREEVGRGGIIRDQHVRDRVVAEIIEAARGLGFIVEGTCESPITGTEGNVEYLAHFTWQGPQR
jgi:23S rRNA (cytidine1920-2'-O)/16S rRNA (cytidine1409-2'-O)-methyltransferase